MPATFSNKIKRNTVKLRGGYRIAKLPGVVYLSHHNRFVSETETFEMENYQQPNKDKDFYMNNKKLFSDKVGHLDRRTEFRKYLENTGVLDKLTEIFMDLYEYPAINIPVPEYVRQRLTDPNPDHEEITKLRPQLEEAYSYRDSLKMENDVLRTTIDTKINNTTISNEEIN